MESRSSGAAAAGGSELPAALPLYLDMLFGGEPDGTLVNVRRRGRHGFTSDFLPVRERAAICAHLAQHGARSDTYVAIAPRRERSGRREAVERVHVLYADCDSEESRERLSGFRPAPSMVLHSGGGWHAYWSLWPPIGADEYERAVARLIPALDSDTACKDAARVARPPGTKNFKYDEPRDVRVLIIHAERTYTASEVVGQLPEPVTKLEPRRRPALGPSRTVLHNIPSSEYVRLLTEQEPGRDGKIRCPLHEDRTPSLHVYADGWFCHGCDRGGDIFTLAAELWGLDSQRDFRQVKLRLLEQLTGRAAA